MPDWLETHIARLNVYRGATIKDKFKPTVNLLTPAANYHIKTF